MIVALLTLAYADPAADVVRQRQLVDQAAAAVAEGRAEGLRRAEIAERMAVYRAAAAELEQLEAAVGPPAAAVDAARHAAADSLLASLAEGTANPSARAVLSAWLGEPSERLAVLTAAVAVLGGTPDPIRRGVLLDVIEQSDGLAVLLAFDAAADTATRDALLLRASTLRRRAPGQTPSMSDEVDAVRALEQAAAAGSRATASGALREQVVALRARAAADLGGQP